MINIIENIARLLDDAGIGEYRKDIFIGTIPEDVNNGIMLQDMPSGEQRKGYDIFEQVVDIYVKNENPSDGIGKLQEVFGYLNRLSAKITSDGYIDFVYALTTIEDVGQDINKRQIYKTSFRVIFRDTPVS